MQGVATAVADADNGGREETRRTTSGAVLQFGHRSIKSRGATQEVAKLSSGGTERYVAAKRAGVLIGAVTAMRDL